MSNNKRKQDEGAGFWSNDEFVDEKPTSAKWRGLIMLVPLLAFLALAIMFSFALFSGDPSRIPSALISKPAPDVALPPVEGVMHEGAQVPGFSRADLATGRVSVVNIWASWCAPCRVEHEFLVKLRELRPGANLYGINYKDNPDTAARFLRQLGNPFDAIGEDERGRVGVEWGVTGVPETFVVDGDGTIIYKLVGPVTAENLEQELLPAIDGADPAARRPPAAG